MSGIVTIAFIPESIIRKWQVFWLILLSGCLPIRWVNDQ